MLRLFAAAAQLALVVALAACAAPTTAPSLAPTEGATMALPSLAPSPSREASATPPATPTTPPSATPPATPTTPPSATPGSGPTVIQSATREPSRTVPPPTAPPLPSPAPTLPPAPTPIVVQPTSAPESGILGQIFLSPICPVENIDNPCPPLPIPATLTLLDATRQPLRHFATDELGRFRLLLAPGSYILLPEPRPRQYAPEQEVLVPSGSFIEVTIFYDSGIR